MKSALCSASERCMAILVLFSFCTLQSFAQTDTVETNVPHLKNVYANDFYIGCLLSYPHVGFPDDPVVPGQSAVVAPHGGDLIKYHMNSMSPGNNMKPMYTVNIAGSAAAYTAASPGAQQDSVDTHPIIQFNANLTAQLNWAQRQGFTFRGHTLVWHNQTPAEFFRSGYTTGGARLTKEKMIARMDHYIKEVIRLLHESWPGLLSAIDVVNEAVNDNGTDRTTSEWYVTFGDISYIMKAFELARAYTALYSETQIKLYYNDYNTHNSVKADGIVRTCGPIFRAGFLDGIGMQEHDSNSSPTAAQWKATYSKFDTICTEMAVTELDVSTVSSTNNPSASILATQANQYGQLFKCFVERSYKSGRGKIISVSKDGLNDQYTFVTNQSSSLWTTLNKCKPSFYAAVNVGLHYNALDSLVAVAETLQEGNYTSGSWAAFSAVLASAKAMRGQDYSSIVSADTTLGSAKAALQAALDGLIVVGIVSDNGSAPGSFELSQNFPNPFNPTTAISYQLSAFSMVKLTVHDLLGRKVAVLVDEAQSAGPHTVKWDASGIPSGVYLYKIETNTGFVQTKKLTLLK